ncbi:hypothetical protein BAUCODRAFT_159522 [Baudoinia panamericana UAMH 10762]|uniref:CFEM domain-containing protein n=1 Tax=Baudoinia panamericana (strain UAMH 10762) TaxID=717646 RepID=M2LFF7_BAUPA|nr:uncharacterized protein BAUCODRAFT_159522 [Baudoinia panamericana UAMH 10762]EMC92772.1 hypothetical protein BAUCODRAFT_159522 [Baudoinia panamericana UAMH 10762]
MQLFIAAFVLTAVRVFASPAAVTLRSVAASTVLPAALPACAEPALLAAIQASGCAASDAQCICFKPTVISSLTAAIQSACSPADQAAVVAFASTYCGTAAGSASGAGASAALASVTATTEVAVTATSQVSGTAGALTVASMPSDITTEAAAPTPTGSLVTDTSSLYTTTITSAMEMQNSTTTTTTTHSSTAKPTNGTYIGAADRVTGLSGLAAVGVAVGAIGLGFAEF